MTDFFSKMMTSNCESSKRNLIVNQLCNRSNDIHFNNDDLIDQEETPESDKATSNEESDSDSGSGSEDESIEIDEEECERRKDEYLLEITDLEKQFSILKDQLYIERLSQVERKLEEVKAGRAIEYLQPLEELQDNMRIRTEVAGILRELKLSNVRCQHEAELIAAKQHLESETQSVRDMIEFDIKEKIRRLEEDKNSVDSDLWSESSLSKKKKRYTNMINYEMGQGRDQLNLPDRRRKPVTVSGPYIVYMLKENEIMEDWNVIRRAIKSSSYI